jgi:hypothetical protein
LKSRKYYYYCVSCYYQNPTFLEFCDDADDVKIKEKSNNNVHLVSKYCHEKSNNMISDVSQSNSFWAVQPNDFSFT